MKKGKIVLSLSLLVLTVNFLIVTIPPVYAYKSGPICEEYMVEMRDGIRLYTRVYKPDPTLFPPPYPVILTRTPYGIGVPGSNLDPVDWSYTAIITVMQGYAYVEQDTRGRFFSEGIDNLFYNDMSDGYDTIDWIASQEEWCDGNIGVAGYSAPGITSFMAAAEYHPNLKAIAPLSSSGNLQNDLTFDGGAFRGDALLWGLLQTLYGLSDVPNGHLQTVLKELYVYKDLYLIDVYGIIEDMLTHVTWHNPTLPYWPDNYPNATASDRWMHLPLYDFDPSYALLQPFGNEILSHPSEDAFRNHFKVYDTVSVPTLLTTGWYDFFAKCQVDAFVALQDRDIPVKILIGPGTHGSPPPIRYFEWFDYWLKGIDNGIMDEPPVFYYSLEADEWRWADQWPPEGVEFTNYYLHNDGFLSTDPCCFNEPYDDYPYDPMDPVLTMGGTNEPFGSAIKAGSFDQTPVVEGREDIISFTTSELTEDVEIAGPLEVFLSASSNCEDTDFTAKLIDVHPGGELMLVADGIIRARYRNSMASPEPMSGNPDNVYSFEIDLGDICQVFKEGHRIRVDISSSNFPKYDRNLNTGGELYQETEYQIAQNYIYHDSENPSYIKLPIVSPKPNVFEGSARVRIPGLNYKGPAELHAYKNAVYLYYEKEGVDQWIKWDIKFHKELHNIEIYICRGEYGTLVVTKFYTRYGLFVTAVGRKVRFHAVYW
jgi:predicted acyl esterase